MRQLSRETEALIERGRGGGPPLTSAHRARLRGAILARAAAGAAIGTTTTSVASAWTAAVGKLAGAVLLVTATGAGVVVGTGAWSPRAPAMAARAAAARGVAHEPVAVPLPVPGAAPAESVEPELGRAPSPETATVAGTAAAAEADRVPQPAALAPTVPERPVGRGTPATVMAEAAPVAVAVTESVPGTVAAAGTGAGTVAGTAAETVAGTVAGTAPAAVPVDPSAPPLSTLEREASLLHEADVALKSGDPNRALTLLAQHASQFPRSSLEPERAAERVFALCQARRVEEARTEAEGFLRTHPSGPLAVRVGAACGGARR